MAQSHGHLVEVVNSLGETCKDLCSKYIFSELSTQIHEAIRTNDYSKFSAMFQQLKDNNLLLPK